MPKNRPPRSRETDLNAAERSAAGHPAATDPFDEIDFGSFFDDYLDPGYKSPASESVEKPSFETFLSAPVTLGDHLRSQLSVSLVPRRSATPPNPSSAISMKTATFPRRSKRSRHRRAHARAGRAGAPRSAVA